MIIVLKDIFENVFCHLSCDIFSNISFNKMIGIIAEIIEHFYLMAGLFYLLIGIEAGTVSTNYIIIITIIIIVTLIRACPNETSPISFLIFMISTCGICYRIGGTIQLLTKIIYLQHFS